MTPLVPLFLSQEVSDRSQVKRWATVRARRRLRLLSAVGSMTAGLLSVRGRVPDGRQLMAVDLSRPVAARAGSVRPSEDREPVCGSAPRAS